MVGPEPQDGWHQWQMVSGASTERQVPRFGSWWTRRDGAQELQAPGGGCKVPRVALSGQDPGRVGSCALVHPCQENPLLDACVQARPTLKAVLRLAADLALAAGRPA